MCLPSRCLAMNVYSDFAIPAFGRYVTVIIRTICFEIKEMSIYPTRRIWFFFFCTISNYYFPLSSLNRLIVLMETKTFFSEVRTESLKLRI
jgi:hypothetical protein